MFLVYIHYLMKSSCIVLYTHKIAHVFWHAFDKSFGLIRLYVDDIPIREFPNIPSLGGQFPAKQMYAYATIWDGSDWATHGGKYKANFTYAPFIAYYSNFIVNGCALPQPSSPVSPVCAPEFKNQSIIPSQLAQQQKQSIQWVQENYMTYDYCQDSQRYPTTLPECTISTKNVSSIRHTELWISLNPSLYILCSTKLHWNMHTSTPFVGEFIFE